MYNDRASRSRLLYILRTQPSPDLKSFKLSWLILLCTLAWPDGAGFAQGDGDQLTIDPDYTAERLVTEVFATDRCKTIFNVERIGDNPEGVGYFSGPQDIVGFERGIILSTGNITDAVGPNMSTKTGSKLSGPTSDPDLDRASSGDIHDRSGVEFDFIPLEPTVTFRYVFASEEYCEFVGAQFNDIFGFFISGPGFNGPYADGAINVARVPGTNQPVTINSINYDVNKKYYLDNESPEVRKSSLCGGGSDKGPRFGTIEYDGQTVILTATINVEVCETYHIRLLVGDVSDSDLDSAVFLEAGSFDLGASATLEGSKEDKPIVAYEGCTPATLRIIRGADSSIDRDQVVTYRVSSSSEATEGTDFDSGRGLVTIPAGEDYIEVPIEAFEDDVVEGDETAWIVLNVPCACFSDSVRLIVREPGPMEIGQEPDFYYCPGDDSRLSADVQGGVPPFAYAWNFGSNEAEPVVPSSLPDTVSVRITDACGQVIDWRAAAKPSAPPALSFPNDKFASCWGDTASIEAELVGLGPFNITYRIDGGDEQRYTLEGEGTQSWPVTRGGTYQITSVEDRACAAKLNELVEINFYQPVLNPSFTDPTCANNGDGSFQATHLATVPPYTYRVNGEVTESLVQDNQSAGTYVLEVADALGCSDSAAITLIGPDSLRPIEIDCAQLRHPPLQLTADGGVPPYQYRTVRTGFRGPEFFEGLEAGNAYQLVIRDAAGCEIEQADFFYPQSAERSVSLPVFVDQELNERTSVDLQYHVPLSQIVSYEWQPADYFECPSCPASEFMVPYTQNISLIVKDVYGCTDSLTTRVAIDGQSPLYVPNAFSPNGDGNNDFLTVFGVEGLVRRVVSFRVYTRWGDQVWEDADFTLNAAPRGWDGQLGNRPANSGVYTWVAEIERFDGTISQLGGTTILLGR